MALLKQIGVSFSANGRSYKPTCRSDSGIRIKLLKSQNIPELVALGGMTAAFPAATGWLNNKPTL